MLHSPIFCVNVHENAVVNGYEATDFRGKCVFITYLPGRSSQLRDAPPARAVVLDGGVPPHGGQGGPADGEHRGGASSRITTRGASHGSQ